VNNKDYAGKIGMGEAQDGDLYLLEKSSTSNSKKSNLEFGGKQFLV